MSEKLSLIGTLLALSALIFIYSVPLGSLPPLGAFFHPVTGFWANAETRAVSGEIDLSIRGGSGSTSVYFDNRGVPHIFAESDEELYFAQGYITARDRLFQMELQIRAAGGRLSEWLGPELVEYDRNQRRLGMVYGAEQALEEILQNDTTRTAIEAYADGVNAYINTLRYENYPLEYKILNTNPAEWKPLNTALLLKYMTQMLAARSDDFETSNAMAYFGEEFVDQMLSRRSSFMDPIVPPETNWNFEPSLPSPPDTLYSPAYADQIESWKPNPLNGSNNWVVDGSKTASGHPILSNDMHLNMSLPSIWYEVQLHSPDQNVYGVSLQGTPAVIVGYNEHIAWGSTNTGADVMDWYEITFRDEDKDAYLHDGEWKPVSRRTETIHIKGEESVIDTLLFTHHGPIYEPHEPTSVSETIQADHALRWIGHDPSNEFLGFYKLNRAQTHSQFKDAFRSYRAPAQNMNFAAVEGDIAIQTVGSFPIKWTHQGRTVGDGSDPAYDWGPFIPYAENPFAHNPERNFLSAANQYPVSDDYPYYLGDSFAPYERGRRINDLLRDMDEITVQDFEEMLMDNFSYHAYNLLPVLLDNINTETLSDEQLAYIERLENWGFHNDPNLEEPSLFYFWWQNLYRQIWNDEYDTEFPMRRPSRDNTLDLIINDPASNWFDDVHTNKRETLSDIVLTSFKSAWERLESEGEPGDDWLWGNVSSTSLRHTGQIPGLGVRDLFTGGGVESINAIRGSHGPSWRMIVELDPDGVRGYGVYPGGQSGNPGSKTYDEFIEAWRTGDVYELNFLRSQPENFNDFPLVLRF